MKHLFRNIRFYILAFSVLISFFVWIQTEENQLLRTQIFALLAVAYLYIAILATPLIRTFPKLPFKAKYIKARRAIGVSAFYFALLHSSNAFFGLLGGLNYFNLPFDYLWKTFLGGIALFILLLMTLTSFDWAAAQLTFKRWKLLHRMVYIAIVLILIHALLLGSHFQDLSKLIPRIFYFAFALLIILEVRGLEQILRNKFLSLPRFSLLAPTFLLLLIGGTLSF